jgi:hypothetical protein
MHQNMVIIYNNNFLYFLSKKYITQNTKVLEISSIFHFIFNQNLNSNKNIKSFFEKISVFLELKHLGFFTNL